MDRLLYVGMAGARRALDLQDIAAHNLANVTTPGFRETLSVVRAHPVEGEGAPTRTVPALERHAIDASAGPVRETGRPLDVALQGNAWLAVEDESGQEAYTRRGDIQIDAEGVLRLGGRPLVGEAGQIAAPLDGVLNILDDGQVVSVQGRTQVPLGRLKLVTPDQDALVRLENGLFRRAGADGAPVVLDNDETARVRSGALEGANLSAAEAMVDMIDIARRYDLQMRSITTADESAARANQLLSLS